MATIRARVNADGTCKFHVQVRMSGFPARTASLPTLRQVQRWAKTIEATMTDGRPFRDVEARGRTLGEALSYGVRFAWPVTAVARSVPSVDVSIFHVNVPSAVKCCTMRMSSRVPLAILSVDQVHTCLPQRSR